MAELVINSPLQCNHNLPVSECARCPLEKLFESQLKSLSNGGNHILSPTSTALEHKASSSESIVLSHIGGKIQSVLQNINCTLKLTVHSLHQATITYRITAGSERNVGHFMLGQVLARLGDNEIEMGTCNGEVHIDTSVFCI